MYSPDKLGQGYHTRCSVGSKGLLPLGMSRPLSFIEESLTTTTTTTLLTVISADSHSLCAQAVEFQIEDCPFKEGKL